MCEGCFIEADARLTDVTYRLGLRPRRTQLELQKTQGCFYSGLGEKRPWGKSNIQVWKAAEWICKGLIDNELRSYSEGVEKR